MCAYAPILLLLSRYYGGNISWNSFRSIKDLPNYKRKRLAEFKFNLIHYQLFFLGGSLIPWNLLTLGATTVVICQQ